MSNLTLRSIERDDPNSDDTRKHVLLRKLYRRLIAIGGVYYYLSIPFVIVLTVAVAAGLLYVCLILGVIPITLIAIIIIGALVALYSMVSSLFIRKKRQEPGRALSRDEAPGLWDMVNDVARSVGTQPVDEIRITPGSDMAVYETGSFRERAMDKGKRVLILGVALLNDFSQNAFRAVLAHEYGHLTNRDTAGGDIAIKVNDHIQQSAIAIARAGHAVAWNVAFQFLRAYHFIFRRLSHGATRLQEVLADRVAAMLYGATAFEEGLRHVIRREVEFDETTYWALHDAKRASVLAQNLYNLAPSASSNVEEKIKASI